MLYEAKFRRNLIFGQQLLQIFCWLHADFASCSVSACQYTVPIHKHLQTVGVALIEVKLFVSADGLVVSCAT